MSKLSASDITELAKRAYYLESSGKVEDAIAAYKRLLLVDPNRPDDWYNLGLLQKRARLFHDSLESYQSALEHAINAPEEVHLNRAVILADALRQPEAAAKELRQALGIKADFVPALLNLGNLHEDRGARNEALQCYKKALQLDPDNALSLARVADVTEINDVADPIIGRLESALSQPRISPLDEADMGFALGRLLDSVGDYQKAFIAYQRANQASQKIGGYRYSPAAASAMVDELVEIFGETVSQDDDGAQCPLFICGMFRSGSSLVERILAAHSGVDGGGELEFIPDLVAQHLRPYPTSLKHVDHTVFKDLRERYLSQMRQIGLDPSSATDKRPDNFLHIGLIKRIFPAARILHTVRNPPDNCLSIYFAHLDPRLTYAQSLENVADWYQQYERLMLHWKRLYPDDIYDVSYDKLVASPRSEIQKMLEFCKLEWEEACLSPHSVTGIVRTASSWQVRKPLYQKSSGRHRNYSEQLGEVFGRV